MTVKGVSTTFWLVLLACSTFAIAAGFLGGRSVAAGVLSVPKPPAIALPPAAPMRVDAVNRQLVGAHSLEGADAEDPYDDPSLGVAAHPWPSATFDGRRDRAQLAVVVADAGRAGTALDPFLASPLPFAFVVAPTDLDAAAVRTAAEGAGKAVLVDATDASPAAVAAAVAGTAGVWGSLDARRAAALLRALPADALLVDASMSEDDELGSAARRAGRRLLFRDVLADARHDRRYVEFMLRDALELAQRHGSAIVVVHARADSYAAVARFALQARRAGADIVTLPALAG